MGHKNSKNRNEEFKEALSKFETKEVKDLKKTFKRLCQLSGTKKTIDKQTFMDHFAEEKDDHFHINRVLAEHLFHAFDFRNEEKIDFEEFAIGTAMCCKGSSDEKMEFIFHVLATADGMVSKDDLSMILRTIVDAVYKLLHVEIEDHEKENTLKPLIDEAVNHFGKTESGKLNLEEFKHWAEANSQVMDFFEVLLHKGYQHKYSPAVPTLPEAPIPPPNLVLDNGTSATSELLDNESLLRLRGGLPHHLWPLDMELMYKPAVHGYSLKTFYNKIGKGPTLLVIKDKNGHRFGSFTSTQITDHGAGYYGDEDCFLFKLSPEFKLFIPTGANSSFVMSNQSALAFGGPGPNHGLWLDSDIDKGVSRESPTYGNQSLSSSEEFHCIQLEAWGFKPKEATPNSTPGTLRNSSRRELTSSTNAFTTSKKELVTLSVNKEHLQAKETQAKLVELETSKHNLEAELERIKKQLEKEKEEREKLEAQVKTSPPASRKNHETSTKT